MIQTPIMINLKGMPAKGEVIYKGDPRIETYRRDAVVSGNPNAVVRPRDWQEATDIVKWCNGNNVPLTVCGARTSMTGSSVAEEGVLLTTDHFNKIIDIGTLNDRPYAVVEPAVIAKDFQKIVEEKGFHYPVVPTSCDNAFLGGNVSTNATGEDFYKYGPTRSFVREISFIKADGNAGTLKRGTWNTPKASKGLGGYFLGGEEIDKIIGSEGTLAIITKITFDLLPKIPNTFVILAPFPSCVDALTFIDEANKKNYNPRSIEYIDTFAISLMRTHKSCPNFSDKVKALVYVKDEVFPSPLVGLPSGGQGEGGERGNIDSLIEVWTKRISKALSKNPELMNEAIIATTEKHKNELHELRHQIPQVISETNEKLEKNGGPARLASRDASARVAGGGKVSGDWWVPKQHMLATMKQVYNEVLPLKIDFTMYAHLGDGHPHTTFLCKTEKEKEKAKEMVNLQSRRAVELGGGVAGEHGIGKIKRDLLTIQFPKEIIHQMRAIKETFDPNWTLGRGNIFQK